MDWIDALVAAGTTGLIVVVLVVTFWACAIVAFFSVAINTSRIRKDVAAMREIAEAEFQLSAEDADAALATNANDPGLNPNAPRSF
ncbi:hypothetical protein [Demequina soli]|uniref:hypothetical protein n=1 Tax=Demequina soli TaxID=1638987 RepID=UPI000781C921|nr:hypothetical protein [Demequina soli]